MDCSMPGFPVHHQLLEFAQTQVHKVGDAIQSCHPLSSCSPPASNLSQHQNLFQWVSSSHQVAKVLGASALASVLPMNIQHWFPLELTGLILQSSHICYFVCNMPFLIGCFQNFLFIEVCLYVVEYAMCRYEFLCKYSPWYLLLFSNLYIYVFCQIWESFGCHKSSFIAFLPFIPHFFLCKSNYTCLESLILSHLFLSLCSHHPLQSFFLPPLFFRLYNFYIFKFSDTSVISNLAFGVTQKQSNVVFPTKFFTLDIIFFSVRVFIWLFYSFYFFAEISYLCIYFKHLLI